MSKKEKLQALENLQLHNDKSREGMLNAYNIRNATIAALKQEIAEEAMPKLDYEKPIFCNSPTSGVCILVSNCDLNSYEIKGYDWLRLKDGKFNSCKTWNTKEEAVACYSYSENRCFNGDPDDDLTAMQEDVEEFEMPADGGHGEGVYIIASDKDFIRIGITGKGDMDYDLEEFKEYTMSCRKVIATLERKEASKDE